MWDTLLIVYMFNATLLVVHEIDSAYWKEWEMFRLPGGLAGFLLIHIPLVFLILYGLVLVERHSPMGLLFSGAVSLAGLVAFGLHTGFLAKGYTEFKKPVSIAILVATLGVSVVQAAVTVSLFGG